STRRKSCTHCALVCNDPGSWVMGTAGKAVAIVNVLAVIGVISFAALYYGRHQEWSFAVLEQKFIINSLAPGDQELDVGGARLVDSVGPRMQRALSANAPGLQARTQVDEVNARKQELEAFAGTDVANLQAVLIPLAESAGERAEFRSKKDAAKL